MSNNKTKTIIKRFMQFTGATFIVLYLVAKKKKGDSVYKKEKKDRNPFMGKQVVFVADEHDMENADGVRGHLESVGESCYRINIYERYIKRFIDIVVSFSGLLLLSPLFAGISLAIIIDDPGPVLFTQKRVGKNKEFFKLHKFRSMKMSTPHDVPTHMLEHPEQYITRVGKFLRAHSLDELPQIWDIFIGNMSIIGPRPALWNQDVLVAERDKYGANDVRPGLTGWAQINGRDELEIPVKAKLDGEYVKKESFLFDIKCFFKTVGKIVNDDSVVEGGTGKMKKSGRNYTEGKSDKELIGHIGFGEPVQVDKKKHKKILITGAGSYIGESFKKYAEKHYKENFAIDTIDMIDSSWREKNFSEYDVVYHVAGLAHADVGHVSEEMKEKYYQVNTDLAVEVAKKAKEEGVKEFIFMSSMIIYGNSAPYGKKKIIDENTVPAPANFYGDSKLQADVAIRDLANDNFKVIVLRPPMIYGEGCKGNYQTLIKLAKRLPIFPDIDNERSMLYIGNLCEFLCQIMLIDIKEQSMVLIPQNKEWEKTGKKVKEIAQNYNHKMMITKILNPIIFVGSKIPGKIGSLINKAFGNCVYVKDISRYIGINYNVVDLEKSMKESKSISKELDDVKDVTFIILTKNEEVNLPDCLESIKNFAKRIIVIDSGSENKTIEIAKLYNADIYVHDFENYAKQFNWGIDNTNITTKWTFRLDADERLTPSLCQELSQLMEKHDKDNVNGIIMEAWLYFMGRKIKHGCHNKRKLMLFKTGVGRIEDRKMDEHTVLLEGKVVVAKERFIHYDFKNMTQWINKMNWYATREMQDYYDFVNGKNSDLSGDDTIAVTRKNKFMVYYRFPIFIRSQLLFIYFYIFKFGFLDGKEGFVYHYMYHRWYRTLVDAKILEQQITNAPFEKTGDLK